MSNTRANNLHLETSPYLLQHAGNPVNWFPWGDEALNLAKDERRLILVSIGYSACHWCHVMAHESFEDEATAAFMNQHFINIKIDREERPDLDHFFMDAVQALTGSGGWPLNVFLTPDGNPFYGGTYFPPRRMGNRSSWIELLQAVSGAWETRPHEIEAQALALTNHIKKASSIRFANGIESLDEPNRESDWIEGCRKMTGIFLNQADKVWGGFGQAPKFPQFTILRFLFQQAAWMHQPEAGRQAELTLNKILDGGIYDQIGGGLARYSTDAMWLAPHFEKMLYDNALMLELLAESWLITRNERYREVMQQTWLFLQSEMAHPEGGFFAALDADSEGQEGKFYTWSRNEVDELLGERAAVFSAYYDISDAGNWEGTNILRRNRDAASVALQFNIPENKLMEVISACADELLSHRSGRIKPGLDDKILLSWNALLLSGFAKSAVVFGFEPIREAARKLLSFLLNKMIPGGDPAKALHTWKNGSGYIPAFLDDYAYLIKALLDYYLVDFDPNWLKLADQIMTYVIDAFGDEESVLFYYTSKHQTDIQVRKKEIYDGATPSANAVMAENLIRLSKYFGNDQYFIRAERMLEIVRRGMEQYPGSFSVWASVSQFIALGVPEIFVSGVNGPGLAREMLKEVYFPNKVMQVTHRFAENFPIPEEKVSRSDSAIYVCRHQTCLPPVQTLTAFHAIVAGF